MSNQESKSSDKKAPEIDKNISDLADRLARVLILQVEEEEAKSENIIKP